MAESVLQQVSEETLAQARQEAQWKSWPPRYRILQYLAGSTKKVQFKELARELGVEEARVKIELCKLAKDQRTPVVRTPSPVSKHFEYQITQAGLELLKQFLSNEEQKSLENLPPVESYDSFRWMLEACAEPRSVDELARLKKIKPSSVRVYASICQRLGWLDVSAHKYKDYVRQRTKNGREIKRFTTLTLKKYKTVGAVAQQLAQPHGANADLVPECQWRQWNPDKKRFEPCHASCPNYADMTRFGKSKGCFLRCPDAKK